MFTCTRCGFKRPEKDFYKTNQYRRKYCKFCEHKAKIERTRSRKLEAVKLLGGKCSNCGYNKCIYALEFNHLFDKSFEPSNMFHTMPWSVALLEIKKCELLCANCHREKTFEKYVGVA